MAFHFERDIYIEAPRGAVFQTMSDLEAADEWMPNLVGIDRQDDGEFGVGTRFRETRKMYGREATEVFEVIGCQPDERLEYFVDGSEGAIGKGEFYYSYVLKDVGTGTEIRLVGRVERLGWFGELLARLFKRMYVGAIDEDLRCLKNYLETDYRRASA